MTLKIFTHILTTCLVFGSLYLPVFAADTSKTAPADIQSQAKKSPETHFLDGAQCLQQSNVACATLALANISSLSPYAKLLQGNIALFSQRVDESLRLLLPLQSEKHLIVEAKISLHEHLAEAFTVINDVPQAVEHLMQAKSAVEKSTLPDAQIKINALHQKIWGLINQQDQSQLIAMRGNNTDNDFQGWIDLSLAARNLDSSSSISNWLTNYPDHSAIAFAKTLTQNASDDQLKISLPSKGSIALILPLTLEASAKKAEAFKQGMQATLGKHEVSNEIKVYVSDGNPESIAEQYAIAKSEGAEYFIATDFNHTPEDAALVTNQEAGGILRVGLPLQDEAKCIADFAASHAIQHVVIVAANNEAAKQMTNSFRVAWQATLNVTEQNDRLHVITLNEDLMPGDASLLDLKTKISANRHDMVLLAMSADEASIVRPHLNISTPTMAFSNVHASIESTALLNAVRFVDIPFLLPTVKQSFKDYSDMNSNSDSNELSRWFALGVDTLHLLIAHHKNQDTIINGLTGTLTMDKSGNIQRELSIARFTFDGIELEK